ncbi:MAG: DUF1127 domain-containing protein [Pseudomonadota bacterium]
METTLTRRFAPRTSTQVSIWARMRLWLDLWYERRTLGRLDRRMLADIGIDEATAKQEAARFMWDVPKSRDLGGRYGLDR